MSCCARPTVSPGLGDTKPAAADAAAAIEEMASQCSVSRVDGYELDCYPYTFSPLLLFAQEHYFDKGYSNYNAVAQFFRPVMPCDMLDNVTCACTSSTRAQVARSMQAAADGSPRPLLLLLLLVGTSVRICYMTNC